MIPVIAADGLYKRDVFSKYKSAQNKARQASISSKSRISGPLRGCDDRWRANTNDLRHQENIEPLLERGL
jgi:hypothetical protein